MSVIIKAFPTAFFVNPNVKDIRKQKIHWDLNIDSDNLQLIKIATNIKLEQINYLMENLNIPCKYRLGTYILNNGLNLKWDSYNTHLCAFFTLNNKIPFSARNQGHANYLIKQSEVLMKTFEAMLKKNIRDIKSKEIFYYCYKTQYRAKHQILSQLKEHGIENIIKSSDMEVKFRYNNKNYKFIRHERFSNFYLESEQRISLVNIISGEKNVVTRTMVTNYTNRDELVRILRELGATYLDEEGLNISCELSQMQFLYSKNNSQDSYNLEINRITDENKCVEILRDIDRKYRYNVRKLIYEQIIERMNKNSLQIENKAMENNVVILFINSESGRFKIKLNPDNTIEMEVIGSEDANNLKNYEKVLEQLADVKIEIEE